MMDKHTFIGKQKIGSSDITKFKDIQGIGHDPLYKRYNSVRSVLKKAVPPEYIDFLAVPNYSPDDDTIGWYVDEWKETPERLSDLTGEKAAKYRKIKDNTVAAYRNSLEKLSGEELQVMVGATRFLDDDEFIFCFDDKVYATAWGMKPDPNKYVAIGELVYGSPHINKFKLTFNVGEKGVLAIKTDVTRSLAEGTVLGSNDVPNVVPKDGFEFKGWSPNPIGMTVESDMTFEAEYVDSVTPPPPPVDDDSQTIPPPPPLASIRFNSGENGTLKGAPVIQKAVGSFLTAEEIPAVAPNKGYKFRGWNFNPLNTLVEGDMTFDAVYDKATPWWKAAWVKWLFWILLALLLLLLIAWLFKGCRAGCHREVNGVVPIERITNPDGDTIDDIGYVAPIDLVDGKLPDDSWIVAPVRDEDGTVAPIIRNPGVPPVFADRLFLFLEDERGDIDAFADAFKKAYPGNEYSIIGFDREVKSLLIQIPSDERDEIRRTINSRIPGFNFFVFDEEIYELNGSRPTNAPESPGWHLDAVKARQGWAITKGSPEIVVAVIDDGIDASHPMFQGRIVNAYNVFTQNNHLSTGEGHGTHTAGLAVGSLEYLRQGAAGIAPDCMLMPIQTIDDGICPLSALVSSIMYAVQKNADVVNISIGPSFEGLNAMPVELQNEIAQTQFKNVEKLWQRVCKIAADRNTILVFAAGNDDIISSIPPENRTNVAITVGAVDKNLCPTGFTNYGPCTDISAPGTDIYSSFPVGDFATFEGTSMAAPIVTGTIALMKTLDRQITVRQAYNVLYKTGKSVYGNMPPMVQIPDALEAVKNRDYSAPQPRQLIPVPDQYLEDIDTPASWTDTNDIIVITTPGTGEVVSDPASGVVIETPGTVYPGNSQVTVPGATVSPNPGTVVDQNESDYEAIRRMIEMYRQKIAELENQLPENQKNKKK